MKSALMKSIAAGAFAGGYGALFDECLTPESFGKEVLIGAGLGVASHAGGSYVRKAFRKRTVLDVTVDNLNWSGLVGGPFDDRAGNGLYSNFSIGVYSAYNSAVQFSERR